MSEIKVKDNKATLEDIALEEFGKNGVNNNGRGYRRMGVAIITLTYALAELQKKIEQLEKKLEDKQ